MADPKITIKVEGSGLPQGGSDGQVLTRQDGKAVWGDALPKGSTPHQQLVTDANGVAKWEDKLAYKSTQKIPLVEETAFETFEESFTDDSGVTHTFSWADPTPFVLEFEIGKTYYVNYDGVEYECATYLDSQGEFAIGNEAVAEGVYDGTGEPFFAYYQLDGAEAYYGLATATPGAHTISISEMNTTFTKLDSGYLAGVKPEAHQQLVTDAEGNTKWEEKLVYTEYEPVEVVPETALDVKRAMYCDHAHTWSNTSYASVLIEGCRYRVTLDNKTYVLTAFYHGTSPIDTDNQIGLGDPITTDNIIFHKPDGEYGFTVATWGGNLRIMFGAPYVNEDGSATYPKTVKIELLEESVKTIDPKYLAEDVEPNQQLVTDVEGNVKWEEKLAYSFEETVTEWDGNTSGLTRVLQTNMGSNGLYGPFDYSGTLDDLIGATVTMSDGKTYVITEDCVNDDRTGLLLHSYDLAAEPELAFTTVDNAIVPRNKEYDAGKTYTISTAGLWFHTNGQRYVASVTKETVKTIDPKYLPSEVPVIQSAQVGQTIVVKAVDENGKPTEWEAVGVTVTWDVDNMDSTGMPAPTCSVSYDEFVSAVQSGAHVRGVAIMGGEVAMVGDAVAINAMLAEGEEGWLIEMSHGSLTLGAIYKPDGTILHYT